MSEPSSPRKPVTLAASAGEALLWGAGFTFGRDIIQFVTMLVLVRLLTPQIYGQIALAQTIIAFLALASLKTLGPYPLQARNPDQFDWDAHFTAGTIVNLAAFALTNLTALILFLMGGDKLGVVATLVVVMSPGFLLEIAGTYYGAWLSAHHRWGRERVLLLAGSVSGAGLSIALAYIGWGAFALALANMFFTVPLVVDFILNKEHRPAFSLRHLKNYGQGVRFGINRAASAAVGAVRGLAENAALAASLGFASLGTFTRAFGLAQITSGRVGPLVMQSLFAVLTRAEACTERFQTFSKLLFQGIIWISLPAAVFLGIESEAIVHLLYGNRWESVVPLLPLAAAVVALRGLSGALNQIMLANLQTEACLIVDVAGAGLSVTAIPVLLYYGVEAYIAALVAAESLTLAATLWLAGRGKAANLSMLVGISIPCIAATIAAGIVASALPSILPAPLVSWNSPAIALVGHAAAFGAAYVATLRVCAPNATISMLLALPLPDRAKTFATRLFGARAVAS